MNTDLLRLVDSIARDKNIEKEAVFADLEAAMASAARKAFAMAEDVAVTIERGSGQISASVDGQAIDLKTLGRIAAQTAKQVMIQRIREDERGAIFEEFSQKVGQILTGTVVRYEGGALIVNIGRTEGILPRSEQIPGDQHHPGERIRAMVLNVREEQSQVRIVLTQTHPDYIRKLFEMEVPEVGERIIEIRALAREAGYRTKVAVSSIDSKVDAVGACVGVRGSRIKNIVDELGGEKIDIVRWNESSQVLITNSLKPAEVKEVFLCFELGRAAVIVEEDQLSLAIGKRGQNVRLAAQLTGWDIDILTPAEHNKSLDEMEQALKSLEGFEDVLLDKMLAVGLISLADLAEVGAQPLVDDLGMEPELAERVVAHATVEAKRLAEEAEAAKAAAKLAAAEKAAQEAAGVALPAEGAQAVEAPAESAESQASNEGAIPTEQDAVVDPGHIAEESTAEIERQRAEAEAVASTNTESDLAVEQGATAEVSPAGEEKEK